MPKEFIMRGQVGDFKTTGDTEILNFSKSGVDPGYAYRLIEMKLWGSTALGDSDVEIYAALTSGKTPLDPINPNFGNEALIAVASWQDGAPDYHGPYFDSVIDDLFLITQDLILTCTDNHGGAVNYQLRFIGVKMSGPEEAVTNYKQFSISDGS